MWSNKCGDSKREQVDTQTDTQPEKRGQIDGQIDRQTERQITDNQSDADRNNDIQAEATGKSMKAKKGEKMSEKN